MPTTPQRKVTLALVLMLLCLCSPLLYYIGRPLPIQIRRELYDGVVYYRKVHFTPYPMIAHIITVDLSNRDISFLVTPGNPDEDLPLKARTTIQFLNEFDLQVAVNGDGFTPWHSNGFLDFYPHSGDRITPNGTAASQGNIYSTQRGGPTLSISERNKASFNESNGDLYNAISGDRFIVRNGALESDLDDSYTAPRTAMGLDKGGNRLIIIVVDGRQPFYSSGATMAELARLLVLYGAETAVNFDGGGSSTLAAENWLGWGYTVNSPIQGGIPGWERPVGNHLGIFVK